MSDHTSAHEHAARMQPGCRGPLVDVKVVDLTRVLAGPFCTRDLEWAQRRVLRSERRGLVLHVVVGRYDSDTQPSRYAPDTEAFETALLEELSGCSDDLSTKP